jgi:hypothetical protein
MGHLRSGRILDHATLGATVSSSEDGRVVVTNILTSSDAFRRGLRFGDEIVTFGGRPIGSVNTFKNVLGIFPNGWRVPLQYRREGQLQSIFVQLAAVHSPEELMVKILRPVDAPDPNPKKPDEEEDDEPEQLPPSPMLPLPGMKRPPEHVAKYIERRRGYANFYFNRMNQQRVWQAFASAAGDYRDATATWLLRGETDQGDPVELIMDDSTVTGRLPTGAAAINVNEDLAEQLTPRDSGGLLPAMHLWRRLLIQTPEKFGEAYYLGELPMQNEQELCDVLIGTYNVVECRFFFAPDTGLMHSMEMHPDRDVDPCTVQFLDYQPVGARRFPHRMVVIHGDEVYADIKISDVELGGESD